PDSAPPSQPMSPLLSFLVEPVKGEVETHVTQNLRLLANASGTLHWNATTRIEVTPIRTAVDRLEISLPADYEYDRTGGATRAEIVEDVILDPSKQTAQIKLAQKQIRPFSITLSGSYPVQPGQEDVFLELLRPLNWSVEHRTAGSAQYSPVLD